ncbi:uncharacterized protein V6R79_007713 [Siganus canaliculatus]
MKTMGNLHLFAVILITLCHKVTEGKGKLLDMAPDAVDDMYDGCHEQAVDKFIVSGLLEQEMDKNEAFHKAQSSANQCLKWKLGKTKNHTTALMTYTEADEKFRNKFNGAVETLGVNDNTYKNQFHFKSLHFLLMDSMTYSRNNCKTFYALAEETYTAVKGSKVRLGRFLQVYPNIADIFVDLEDAILLKITSCFFVELSPYVCNDDNSVLLSPAEVFTVEDVDPTNYDYHEAAYTEINLKHSAVNSTHNCFMFTRSTGVSTHLHPTPLVLVLVTLSLSFYN